MLLHGYGMRPFVYRHTAELMADRCRVLVPDLFDVRGRWDHGRVVGALAATLDEFGLGRVSVIGHSFGGGIELGFAARHPERVTELVFSDTLAVSEAWGLADEALRHPWGLLYLVTASATVAFASEWLAHPRQMAEAAWWGFRSTRDGPAEEVCEAGIPSHVLWASRDSILSRQDGEEFAKRLGATFTVARSPDGRPVDHDWMFQNPRLFVAHLLDLHLSAFAG